MHRYAPKSVMICGVNSAFPSPTCCLCFCVDDALGLPSLCVRRWHYRMCQLSLAGLSVSDVVMLISEHLSQLAAIASERTECRKSYRCVSAASAIGRAIVSLLL